MDYKNDISRALVHPDKLGAGARKRKRLKPNDRIRAVMKEYARGTLNSGSGHRAKNRKQAIAIGLSESRK